MEDAQRDNLALNIESSKQKAEGTNLTYPLEAGLGGQVYQIIGERGFSEAVKKGGGVS